ncbi:hypothetical protein SAMN04488003_10549 [Loktanella fryxellensis]|uniref:Transferrin-binding protein B C-lobe/N-lobe beta barrel domain-containing protein n=2 Tax=Loktanella fryxellensis TaxID=245187 RepID=A0A1H8BHE1_9RHOB|nr:hypothetical protein SAMN04488003_10549 [Loktanella fryxellensis]
MRMNAAVVLALCGWLTGCGAGGGSGGDAGPVVVPADLDVTDPRTLPTTGRATYDGYMRAELPTGDDGSRENYLADLRMEVNFATGFDQIRGQATGFEAGGARRLGGALTISGGDVYRDTDTSAAYTFDGALNGTLTDGSDDYLIDAEIEGDFLGADQTAVGGLVFGDITGPEGIDIFDGTFAADRVAD